MSEEVNIGTLPTQETVGDDDYVLLWIAAGTLVRVNGKAFQSQYEAPKVGPLPINLNGIYSSAGQAASIKNDGDQGLVIAAKSGSNNSPANLVGISALYLGSGTTNPLLDKTTANALYENKLQTALGVGSLKNGVPMKMSGASWVNPTAGEEWLGIAQIAGTTVYIVSGGKVTIDGAAFVNGSASVGTPYWWNGSLWDTTKPTAWDAFTGKIVPVSNTEAIVLPFKRRSGAFRPAQSSPDGAGQINIIFRSPSLPANNLLAGVSKGSGTGGLYRSTDNGITWTKLFDFPSGFTSLTDITLGPNGSVLLALGFTTLYTGAAVARDWIYTIPQALSAAPTRAAIGWGSVGKNLNAIAFDGSYTYAPMVTRSTIINLYRSGAGSVSSFTGYAQIATSDVADIMVFGGQVYFVSNSSIHKTPISNGAIPIMAGGIFTGETLSRIASNTANNKTVLVGTRSGNIYRTEDFTAATPTWTAVKPENATAINDLAFNGSVWFAATNNGLYRSGDDGKTWAKMHDSQTVAITAVAADATNKVWIGDANGKIFTYGV